MKSNNFEDQQAKDELINLSWARLLYRMKYPRTSNEWKDTIALELVKRSMPQKLEHQHANVRKIIYVRNTYYQGEIPSPPRSITSDKVIEEVQACDRGETLR